MVTRNELTSALATLEAHLANRVELWRDVITPDGTIVRRIYCHSFRMPGGWQPPKFEDLIATAKGEGP